jgi:O-antigen ligase
MTAIACGLVIAGLVFWEGRDHLRLQLSMLGPQPLLVNDLPFVLSGVFVALLLLVAGFFAWVLKSGGLDRPAMGILALAMVADAVPGLTQIALFLVLIILIRRVYRDGDVTSPLTPLAVPLLLFIISYATTLLLTEKWLAIMPTFLFRMTSNIFLVVLLPALIRTRRQIEVFFHMLLVCACISVMVEWVQWIASAAAGVPITFASGDYNKVMTPWGVFPRLTGLMYHPNLQSNCISTIAVLTLWFGLRPRGTISVSRRVLYLSAYVWLGLGVVFTISRSGWLSLAIATAVVPLVRYPRFAPVYLTVCGLAGAAAYQTGLLKAGYELVEGLNESSADFRWRIDELAIQAFVYNPEIGVGTMGILEYENPWKLQVHDTYLQIASEMGLLGLVSFGAIVVLVLARLIWTLMHSKFAFDRDWAVGLMLASVVSVIQNSFVMFLWVRFLWLMIPLAECVHLVSRDQTGREPDDLPILPPERPALAAARTS